MNTQPLKGFRDFLPEVAIKRQLVIQMITAIFQQYGFDRLETPALELSETLLGKYGDEADKLLYTFEDNGKRKVGLRYDQTVPLSRVIAHYPELTMPFKRYQIQPVWRAENTQKGRYREFLQCDIDVVGTDSYLADAEIVACTFAVGKAVGLPQPKILLNDRTIFDQLGLSSKEIIIIDKLDKIGRDAVLNELTTIGGNEAVERFNKLEQAKPSERLNQIIEYLTQSGLEKNRDFQFDPFLARGLDYYTSTIFELKDPSFPTGSLAGGGRYDKLIGTFSGRDLPAVGVAFGFDRIMDARSELGIESNQKTSTQVLVTIFQPDLLSESTAVVNQLRSNNIAAELYLDPDAKLEKQLKYADKKGIPYAIIIGPEEKNKGVVNLKNLLTREEKREIDLTEAMRLILENK